MRELTIAFLMRFVTIPKDPITTIVSLDTREMDGPVQVVLVNAVIDQYNFRHQ